jgi:hypothetical protein
MELAEPLRPVLALLRQAYPDGLAQEDYWPLLVVLGDVMYDENLALVVAEFTGGEPVVVDNDAAAAHSINPPQPRDRARVRAALEAHGLADLDDERAGGQGG